MVPQGLGFWSHWIFWLWLCWWTASQHLVHVISSDDLWSVGPRRNRTVYHYLLLKLSTLPLVLAVPNCYGWSKLSRTMAFIWSKCHYSAIMKASSRLPTTQFITRRQSTLKFVITFSETMSWRKISISFTSTLKSNLQISSQSPWMRKGFASYGVC